MNLKNIAFGALLALPFGAAAASTNDQIEATSEDSFYYKAFGDGYELGFFADLKTPLSKPYKIEIPAKDNYAGCTLATEPAPSGPEANLNVRVSINTSVEGDSGGCLVLVKDRNNETQAIIKYDYVTNY